MIDRANLKNNSKDDIKIIDKKLLYKLHDHYQEDQRRFESLNLKKFYKNL